MKPIRIAVLDSIISTPTRIILTMVSEIFLPHIGRHQPAASSPVKSILGDKWIDVALQLDQGNERRRPNSSY